MALQVTSGYKADLGWRKRVYVAAEGTLLDMTDSIADAQVNSEVETESYSVYGTPNDKTVSTSVSYPLVINTMYYTAAFETLVGWLETSTDFFWCEIATDDSPTFTLGLYGVEGVTIGAAPTDGLVEAGLTPSALGETFEGKAYEFTAAAGASGNLSLGTVDDLDAGDRVWALLTEINGTTLTLAATVGGAAGTAVDLDETKADIYELGKAAADSAGTLVVPLTGTVSGDGLKGYILVGRSVTAVGS